MELINSIIDDITLLASDEYGDISEDLVAFHKVQAILREHHTYLKGRELPPGEVLCVLLNTVRRGYEDSQVVVDRFAMPRHTAMNLGDQAINEVGNVLADLFIYIHDYKCAPRSVQPDPNIAAVLACV